VDTQGDAFIEAICSTPGDQVEPVLDAAASLIDKSLLQQTEQEGEEPRLLMLETIRSLRTVYTHLKSIYGKNPVTSRSAASRSRCTSRIGGTPKRLLYSRLKWEASWYPTR
jgi:hypothetical protein